MSRKNPNRAPVVNGRVQEYKCNRYFFVPLFLNSGNVREGFIICSIGL